MLSSLDLSEVNDLVVYLLEQQIEEQLWEIWVNKDIELSFDEFKKKTVKKSTSKQLSKEEEEEILNKAQSILDMEVSEEASNIKI